MDDNCLTEIEEDKEKEERIKKKEKEEDTYIKEIDGFPYSEITEYLNKKIALILKNEIQILKNLFIKLKLLIHGKNILIFLNMFLFLILSFLSKKRSLRE